MGQRPRRRADCAAHSPTSHPACVGRRRAVPQTAPDLLFWTWTVLDSSGRRRGVTARRRLRNDHGGIFQSVAAGRRGPTCRPARAAGPPGVSPHPSGRGRREPRVLGWSGARRWAARGRLEVASRSFESEPGGGTSPSQHPCRSGSRRRGSVRPFWLVADSAATGTRGRAGAGREHRAKHRRPCRLAYVDHLVAPRARPG